MISLYVLERLSFNTVKKMKSEKIEKNSSAVKSADLEVLEKYSKTIFFGDKTMII